MMKRMSTLLVLWVVWMATTALLPAPSARPISATSDEALTPPRLVESCRVAPQYPEAERSAGVQGTVLLRTEVKADGAVGTIEIQEGVAGHPAFSEAAIAAVRQWCFEPARRNGEEVALTVVLPVRFQLECKGKK